MPEPRFARAAVPRILQALPGRTVGELLADTATSRPDAEAIVDGARRLTFAELARRVDAAADGLLAKGITAGDVVAYQLPNWWEAVVAFLATARVGAISNPLLPSFRDAELRFTLGQSGARALFAPSVFRGHDHATMIARLRPELPALRHVAYCRDGDGTGPAAEGPTSPSAPRAVDPDDLLLLMYTSGTTAAPKGVLHTHDTLGAEIVSLARVHGLGPDDIALVPSPLTHISGVIHGILAPAILGTTAVLMDRWDPLDALRLIAAERVTYMAGAPIFLRDLARHGADFDTSTLRLFSCGGAAVSPELIRLARQRLPACVAKRVYGSTEFPTISTTGAEDGLTHGIDTEGRAIAPAEVRIVDSEGAPLAPELEGEVQARGPECFVGYSDPALNAEAFTPDGWFRTGDLGVIGHDGYLRITGRRKEVVVRKGEKISMREVEETVAGHPAVAEAAVVALPDSEAEERACVAVVLRAGAELTLAALGDFLGERGLARHKHPEVLEIVDALPRTDSGKVSRAALNALVAARRR